MTYRVEAKPWCGRRGLASSSDRARPLSVATLSIAIRGNALTPYSLGTGVRHCLIRDEVVAVADMVARMRRCQTPPVPPEPMRRKKSSRGSRELFFAVSGGVANGTRTHDNQNHNLGLYQLSYSHHRSQ